MVENREYRVNDCINQGGPLCDPWVKDKFRRTYEGGIISGDSRTYEWTPIERDSHFKKAEEICSKCEHFTMSES